eukprot:6210003-Pleurochrysis_carterae.AAC.1
MSEPLPPTGDTLHTDCRARQRGACILQVCARTISLSAGSLSGGVGVGAAEKALADASVAVRAAEQAYDSAPARELSTQPDAVDHTSLDLTGWKRHAVFTLFRACLGVAMGWCGSLTAWRWRRAVRQRQAAWT